MAGTTWLNDVAEHLEDEIANYAVGTNIFIGKLRDAPAAQVAVYDGGGEQSPDGDCVPLERLVVEVRCRAANYGAAQVLAAAVDAELNMVIGKTFNGALKVRYCTRVGGPPHKLQTDQDGRVIFLARYEIKAERSPAQWSAA